MQRWKMPWGSYGGKSWFQMTKDKLVFQFFLHSSDSPRSPLRILSFYCGVNIIRGQENSFLQEWICILISVESFSCTEGTAPGTNSHVKTHACDVHCCVSASLGCVASLWFWPSVFPALLDIDFSCSLFTSSVLYVYIHSLAGFSSFKLLPFYYTLQSHHVWLWIFNLVVLGWLSRKHQFQMIIKSLSFKGQSIS